VWKVPVEKPVEFVEKFEFSTVFTENFTIRQRKVDA
jgi:hypothetical protein